VFECSIRDFFECQNVVEACWFGAFFTQFREVFECQKLRRVEFLMLELVFLCLSTQSVIFSSLRTSNKGARCCLTRRRLGATQPSSCFLLGFSLAKKSVPASRGDVISCHRPVLGFLSTARSPVSGVRSVGTNNWPLW
jgi:hypothetical protein